jgi:hypothetical protein
MKVVERPKAEIVARVLERIAEGRYGADIDENGEWITFPDYGPTFLEREEYFSEQLGQLEKMRDESEAQDGDSALAEDWSDFWTLKLLEQDPFNGKDIERFLPILKGKPYEEVITYLYDVLTGNLEEAERLLAAGRETIPKSEASGVSGDLDEEFSDDMHERLSSFHARRLSKQFPKVIDRAVGLALLTADHEVPAKVRRYIEEASKSYFNGQWIACLMVCRSSIEFAIRDRLKTSGYASELDAFEKSSKGESLCYLIELANNLMDKRYRDTLEDAQIVRRAAVRAVHAEPPRDDECRDLFLTTRMVMQMLYRQL